MTYRDALGIALAAFLVAAGWFSHSWYSDSMELAIGRVKDEVSRVNAEAIAKIRIENKTIQAKTVERIKTETVYRECVADDAMMLYTNSVIMRQ